MRLSATSLMFLLSGLILAIGLAWRFGMAQQSLPYSEFTAAVEAGKITEVVFAGEQVTGKTVDAQGHDALVHTVAVPDDTSLVKTLQDKGVTYSAREPADCGGASMLLMVLLTGMLWFMLIRPGSGTPPGIATFGKSQARLAPEEGTGVTFKDVAGIDEAEEELNEIVQFLKTPDRFTRLGGKIPKGVLLVGPPGTGKTLLARAVAGEAGVPFFSISGSDFVEMFVGVGAARVRDLFKQASDRAPCIIFIDELDAIGKARGISVNGGDTERDQTLNQLLVEMDGFDGRKGVIILAATNRPEVLDQALLRAGRFDRQIVVDRPDVRGRESILKVHARSLRLSKDVDLRIVAQRTSGFSGADLANALNEAALLAARRGKDEITFSEIDEAVERLSLGTERKSRRLSESERRMTAYHEAGHAICGAATPHSMSVSKISIIPRGFSGGVTRFTPPEDRISWSRQELIAQLIVSYGGMAAEETYIGDVTTGAQADIQNASNLARRMVTEFGMSDKVGAINYGGERPNPFGLPGAQRDVAVADETAREIDAEVRRLLENAHNKAREIVREHRNSIEAIARALLEKETLDGEALEAYLAPVKPSGVVTAIRPAQSTIA